MARPVIITEIDFNSPPLTASAGAIWADVTDYVHTIQITRGRSDALNRVEAGTASVLLDNSDRRFDPTYTSSTYYPYIVPMKKIRIWALYGGTHYDLFTGYIRSWPPDWPGGLDATTRIECVDAFSYFAAAKLNGAYANEFSNWSIDTWLTVIGWPAADRNLFAGQSQIQAGAFVNTPALQHFQNVADVESGIFFMDEQGRPTLHNRHYRLTYSLSSAATFGDLAPELPWYRTAKKFDDTNIWNEARITRTGGVEQVSTNATSQAAYFTRTYTKTLPILTDGEAQALANWIVSRYGAPVFRYTSVTLDGLSDDLLWPEMLGRTISERITIKERPPGGSGTITQDCYIEGVTHDIADDRWMTTFQVSNADSLAYWVLGSSTLSVLGSTTRLAY